MVRRALAAITGRRGSKEASCVPSWLRSFPRRRAWAFHCRTRSLGIQSLDDFPVSAAIIAALYRPIAPRTDPCVLACRPGACSRSFACRGMRPVWLAGIACHEDRPGRPSAPDEAACPVTPTRRHRGGSYGRRNGLPHQAEPATQQVRCPSNHSDRCTVAGFCTKAETIDRK